jgi:hypothetical protein
MDLRLPENRVQTFSDFYRFHLEYDLHPGMVYSWLPAIADHLGLDEEGRAWLTWINGNTQNPVTSLLLLQEAPSISKWHRAVVFWDEHFKKLQWDTDRRHQKANFGEATKTWVNTTGRNPVQAWHRAERDGWKGIWKLAFGHPFMGRLSAWSMSEYAYILGLHRTDAGSLLLDDPASTSHRNGLRILTGSDIIGTPWDKDKSSRQEALGLEATARTICEGIEGATFWTLESALCTFKSWHKPNRRYPGVYADMAHDRLVKNEATWGKQFGVLWQARKDRLPVYLRLEDFPNDPGMCAEKQNHYLQTGETVTMGRWKPQYFSSFDEKVDRGEFSRA